MKRTAPSAGHTVTSQFTTTTPSRTHAVSAAKQNPTPPKTSTVSKPTPSIAGHFHGIFYHQKFPHSQENDYSSTSTTKYKGKSFASITKTSKFVNIESDKT